MLTKTDIADEEMVQAATARLASLSPGVPMIDGGLGRREPGALGRFLSLGGHQAGDAARVPGPTLFDFHQTDMIPVDGPLDRAGIDALLDRCRATSADTSLGRRVWSTHPMAKC